MDLDEDRLKSILNQEHSFYGSRPATYRTDSNIAPRAREIVASQFRPEMRVLDMGCGNGGTLVHNANCFDSALGVDNDPSHIELAEEALRNSKARNVEFRLLDFLAEGETLAPESFDFVYTERAPIGYDSFGVQAALRVLKPGGLIFCELIGQLHHQEVGEVFGDKTRLSQMITVQDQMRVSMERNGVGIRFAADVVEKRIYPDVYEWLQFQCSIWAWGGGSLPRYDDPRLKLFAERNTTSSGEIETTHHVTWVGGVKLSENPYPEFDQFQSHSKPHEK